MWSLAGSQVFDQLICGFGSKWQAWQAGPAAFGLSCWRLVFLLLWAWLALGQQVGRLGPVCGAASLCSWWAPTRGFRCGVPAGVLGVGGQLGFQLWAPSPLIWVFTISFR